MDAPNFAGLGTRISQEVEDSNSAWFFARILAQGCGFVILVLERELHSMLVFGLVYMLVAGRGRHPRALEVGFCQCIR